MYGKLFVSMYDGSIYGKWEAIVTFQQLIILADKDGTIEMTPQALSARTSIPIEIINKGIGLLESPDPTSRTPDEEGRRIVRIEPTRPWGWHITNYAKYRAIRTAEERREYHKQYWHKRKKKNQPDSTGAQQNQPIVEVKVDVKADTKIKTKGFRPPSLQEVKDYCKERGNKVDPQSFVDHYETNGWVRGKTKIKSWKACVRTWEKKAENKDCKTPAQIDIKTLAKQKGLTARPGESWEQYEQRVRNTR